MRVWKRSRRGCISASRPPNAKCWRGSAASPVEDVETQYHYNAKNEVTNAIQRRQKVHEDELFAQDPIGQSILELRRAREELLDVIWLATSPKQIKALWSKVAELLGDEQTRLQKDALEIESLDE